MICKTLRDTGVADMYARTVKPDFALSKVVYKNVIPVSGTLSFKKEGYGN